MSARSCSIISTLKCPGAHHVLTWFPALDPEDSCLCCHKLPTILSNDFVTMSWGVGHFPCTWKEMSPISFAHILSSMTALTKDTSSEEVLYCCCAWWVQWSRINVPNIKQGRSSRQVHNITRIFIYSRSLFVSTPSSLCTTAPICKRESDKNSITFSYEKYETFACSSHELYRVFISIILLLQPNKPPEKSDGRKHSILYPVIAGTNLHLCCCFRPIVVLSSPCGINCTRRGLLTTLKQCGNP